jgi:hypothetical protein
VTPAADGTLPPERSRKLKSEFGRWLLQALPFLVLGIGALVGMAWTTATGQPRREYWMFYTPLAMVICIVEGYRSARTMKDWGILVLTQVLQWGAVGIAMYILMVTAVRGMMNEDSVGLTLLTLIALGVFLSGLHERVGRLCVLGIFLAAAVPVIAWMESAVLLMSGVFLLLCVLGFAIWYFTRR